MAEYPEIPKEKKKTDYSIGQDTFRVAPHLENTFARDSNIDFSSTSLINKQVGAISIKDASKSTFPTFRSQYGELGLKNNDYSTCSMVNMAMTQIPDIHG